MAGKRQHDFQRAKTAFKSQLAYSFEIFQSHHEYALVRKHPNQFVLLTE